jgi:hypothetical protein
MLLCSMMWGAVRLMNNHNKQFRNILSKEGGAR